MIPVTISSNTVWRRSGCSLSRRVTSQETRVNTAMIAQVVTTGRVMARGPRWNRIVLPSGDGTITRSSAPRAMQAYVPIESPERTTAVAAPRVSPPGRRILSRRQCDRALVPPPRGGHERRRKGLRSAATPRNERGRQPARRALRQMRARHRSFPMYPVPRQCAAEGEAGDEQSQRPKDPRTERTVEPAAGKNADQGRRHDGPAERPDHRQVLPHRSLAFALPTLPPAAPEPDRLVETLGVIGPLFRGRRRHGANPSPGPTMGAAGIVGALSARRKRAIWRIAAR